MTNTLYPFSPIRQTFRFLLKPLHLGISIAILSSLSVPAVAAPQITNSKTSDTISSDNSVTTNSTTYQTVDNPSTDNQSVVAMTPVNPMPVALEKKPVTNTSKYDPLIANGVPLPPSYPVDVPQYMSLEQAQRYFVQVSPKVAADNAAIVNSKKLADSTKNLNKPVVYIGASAAHVHGESDVSTGYVKDKVGSNINDQLSALPLPLPVSLPTTDIGGLLTNSVPDSVPVDVDKNTRSANVTVLWSAYNGGKTKAITDLLNGRTDESRADADLSLDEQYTTLTKRYFQTQLAIMAAYLRTDALNAIRQTDHAAQRALDVGLISEVERLEAKTALANAEYENSKAQNDAELAMVALQRMLRTDYSIKPTNPLFVSSKPLPPLEYFQEVAKTHHPGFAKVAAKYNQAKALHHFSESNYKPTVTVFGRQGVTDNGSDWVAGVAANWKLWGGIDRKASSKASEAQLYQAEFSQIDVQDNLMLLVEKNWQTLKNAQQNFLSLNTNIKLAKEMLRFRQLGLQEGVNTATEVMLAEANLEKSETEQAKAANDYVQALADLMQSCGTPLDFNQYMQAADIELPAIYFEHSQTAEPTNTLNTSSNIEANPIDNSPPLVMQDMQDVRRANAKANAKKYARQSVKHKKSRTHN